jgi:hypothetical protein
MTNPTNHLNAIGVMVSTACYVCLEAGKGSRNKRNKCQGLHLVALAKAQRRKSVVVLAEIYSCVFNTLAFFAQSTEWESYIRIE